MSKKSSAENYLEFDGQRSDEQLLFIFRRHIIAMRKGFYLLFIPFALSSIPVFIWQSTEVLIIPVVGLAVGLMLFFYHFIMWYFTIYIVTDQRIRQITQHGFFGKDVVELGLSKIQNISYTIPGLSGELLGFGTVVLQTVVGDLVINKIEHPDKIYNKLQDAVAKATADQEQEYYEETPIKA